MVSMDCDSDPDTGPTNSPMQHSGWETCQKVLSYVHTLSSFRSDQNSQLGHPQPNSFTIDTSGVGQSKSLTFQTPESHRNKSGKKVSAVGAFSSFRSKSAISPREGEKSFDISDEGENLDKNDCFSESMPPIAFNSFQAMTSKPRDKTSSQFEKSRSLGREKTLTGMSGDRKLSKQHSMPVESPSSFSPRRWLDPTRDRGQRSHHGATISKPSGNVDCGSSNVSLRSLCKQGPSKRRKLSHDKQTSDTKSPKKSFFTFKSFLLLNVIIGAIIGIYAMQVFHSRCASFSRFDSDELKNELTSQVFGQHIASKIIPEVMYDYLALIRDRKTTKPLVLSLHGWTGVGKNHVSKIVSDYFPYRTVNKLLVPLHFAHETDDEIYAQVIPDWIHSNITQCHVNFVILDEMDKASEGVIKGVIDAIDSINKKNMSNSPIIFLLLSNSKGADITKLVFHLTSSGHERDSISQNDLLEVFETEKSLWYSELVSRKLIDAFIPFLPLDKNHIVQCIKNDLALKGLKVETSVVSDVVHEMSFFKMSAGTEFSQTGCKRVSDKVNLVYHKHDLGDL